MGIKKENSSFGVHKCVCMCVCVYLYTYTSLKHREDIWGKDGDIGDRRGNGIGRENHLRRVC